VLKKDVQEKRKLAAQARVVQITGAASAAVILT